MIHQVGYVSRKPAKPSAWLFVGLQLSLGSGLSKYAGRDRNPSEIASLIVALVSELKLKSHRFIAVGHSMGAMVASELALQIPLSGVVLIGPVHPTPALGDIFAARIQTIQESMNYNLFVR